MSRLSAFWSEFMDQLKWVGPASEKAKRIGTQVPLFLLALLSIPAGQAEWAAALRPWAVYLLIPIVVYLLWKAAIAWDRTSGPRIEVGPIEPDERRGMFEMWVRNAGTGTVTARLYGTVPKRVWDERELLWRELTKGQKMILSGSKKGTAGLLHIHTGDAGNPQICLAKPADVPPGMHAYLPICDDVPLDRQGETIIDVRVVFEVDEKEVKDRAMRFVAIPNPNGPLPYSVRRARG